MAVLRGVGGIEIFILPELSNKSSNQEIKNLPIAFGGKLKVFGLRG
jgi:hypothetical protein